MDQCKHKGHLLKLYYRNMLKSHHGDSETFQEYRETVFLPYITTQLRNVERMDVVCGTELHKSIKMADSLTAFKNQVRALDLSVVSKNNCKNCKLCNT